MKKRIFILVFLAVLLIIAVFSGCQKKKYSYPFTQALDNVVSVEIRKYDWETEDTTPLLTLDEETAQSLLADIAAADCYKQYGDYSRVTYSETVVYITYENGEAEVIGNRNTARVDSFGTWWVSSYYFNDDSWRQIVSKYIDTDVVSPSEEME